jgi:hypothetical protein
MLSVSFTKDGIKEVNCSSVEHRRKWPPARNRTPAGFLLIFSETEKGCYRSTSASKSFVPAFVRYSMVDTLSPVWQYLWTNRRTLIVFATLYLVFHQFGLALFDTEPARGVESNVN